MAKKKVVNMSTEEAKEMLIENIEKLFKMNGISGIISVPNAGTFGIFKNTPECLAVLNHAKIEEKRLEFEREREAKQMIRGEYNEGKEIKSKPSYIS